MPPLSPIQALTQLRQRHPGPARLYVAGCSGEPIAIADAFRTVPDLAKDVTFLGIWIPGVNRTDWASLHETARAESIFLSPDLRPSFESRKTAFIPLTYTQAWPWLETTPLDAAIVMVSPPGPDGKVSLGVSADFSGAPLSRSDVTAVALINPAMPSPPDSPRIDLSRFQIVAEAHTPLIEVAPTDLPDTFKQIAVNIAGLVNNRDTLQFGIGNVQQAVLEQLGSHRNLSIHAGMISDAILPLLENDVINRITTGVAIGTRPLYQQVAHDGRIAFRPVSLTHAISTLCAIPQLKAINSILEVDLFGQANAEFIGAKQVSGTGGLVDFLRGAAIAKAGMAITALPSTAHKGSLSRIVARLPADATSIARADMGLVVTEHGIADLRGKSLDARADALIAIADPAFRASLSAEWDRMRKSM